MLPMSVESITSGGSVKIGGGLVDNGVGFANSQSAGVAGITLNGVTIDTRYYPSIRLCMGLNVTHADSPNGANARQMWHESPCAALGTTAQGLRPMFQGQRTGFHATSGAHSRRLGCRHA